MSVNKKWLYLITLSVLLVSIVSGCTTTGCSPSSLFTPSISGVISVPITGEQHYESGDSFDDDFNTDDEIMYGDTAYGVIGTSSDVDVFWFTGSLNDEVIIDIDAEAFGSGLDSVLSLYHESDLLLPIAENDDYPDGWPDDPAHYIFVLDSHIEKTLESTGIFYIVVRSYGGTTSGSYRLRLFNYDSGGTSAGMKGLSADAEFVPDEIIVKYKPGFDTESVKGLSSSSSYMLSRSNRDTPGGALEVLKLDELEQASKSVTAVRAGTLTEAARLNALPYVEYAEPNYIMRPTSAPNDTYYHLQWHYPLIRLDQVWDLVTDASGVRVAVIDTGIARTNGTSSGDDHPDLTGIFVDEYDFISDKNNALDGDGIDDDATDPGDDPNGVYSSFHGTHVIGTIGALTNNSIGVAGVAGGNNSSGVRIMPLRALGAQGGNVYDLAQAVLYASRLSNVSGQLPSSRADIINMSLGAAVDSQTLRNAIIAAYNAGVLIIASAGNEGTSVPFYPAAYTNVVSVSAVGAGGELSPYSSFGGTVEIAAPGGDTSTDLTFDGYPDGVLSTLFDQHVSPYTPNYTFYQGTSMAAPHVSGVCALMLAANGDLQPSDVRNILASTAIDLGQPGKDIYYGYGLVNAYAAVKATLSEAQDPVLYPFPRALKLDGTDPVGRLTLKNIGGSGTITVNDITEANDPEGMVLTITPETGFPLSVEGTKWVDITLSTYASGVEDDKTHYARLEITYDDPSKTEYVYILYNSEGITSTYENEDVGNIFVVAIDPVTYKTVAQDVTTYSQNYIYNISGLPPGSYVIAAGTDRDSDLGITDAGEAIGLYPVYGSWMPIDIGEGTHLTGIDFQVIDNIAAAPGSLRFTRNTALSD